MGIVICGWKRIAECDETCVSEVWVTGAIICG